eukprot:scaffold3431_cov128-Isochrysis_galbana.AAC.6
MGLQAPAEQQVWPMGMGSWGLAHPFPLAAVCLGFSGSGSGFGGNNKQNSASAWRVAMAPRQLLLELEEVDTAAAKGPKRVRADSTNEGSTQ